MKSFSLDMDQLLQQAKDYLLIDMVGKLCDDKESVEMVQKTLMIFVDHGVPADVGLAILKEMAEALNSKEGE